MDTQTGPQLTSINALQSLNQSINQSILLMQKGQLAINIANIETSTINQFNTTNAYKTNNTMNTIKIQIIRKNKTKQTNVATKNYKFKRDFIFECL